MENKIDLRAEQERTLSAAKLPANPALRLMFWQFDAFYGKARSLPKLMVLEILARYPYWAWENGAYHLLSKLHSGVREVPREKVETALRHIRMGREAQDNEQWHMLLWADLCRQRGVKLGLIRHFLIPRAMTFGYFFLTRFMYRLNPVWSFSLNAAFESHAEHEYMLYAKEHPEFERESVESVWFKYYPAQRSLADLLRRVGLDERGHMNDSLLEIERLMNTVGSETRV